MDEVEQGRASANAALDALQRGRREDAAVLFDTAVERFGDIADARVRREELGVLADLVLGAGYPDLSLQAAEDAVAAAEELGEDRPLAESLLSLGNATYSLGDVQRAEATYRRALEVCVAGEHWDDAASASTNLAIMLANDQRLPDAVPLLDRSLEYLARQGFWDTEVTTRIVLVTVLDALGTDDARAIAVGEALLAAGRPALTPEQLAQLQPPLRRAAERVKNGLPPAQRLTWDTEHSLALS